MGEMEDGAHEKSDGNLTQRLVGELGRAIVTEQFNVAAPFPVEAELCRRYGASRSIVREAVKMLTAKGLLRARQRAGTIVEPEDSWNLLDPDILRWMLERDFSIDLLIEFTEVRLSIEPQAAGLAANGASAAQRQRIVEASERMFAAERGEDDALAADIAFHAAILMASNNRFLRQFTGLSETSLRFSIRRTNAYAGVAGASAAEHARVCTAIVEGDARLAVRLLRALIRDALGLLLAAGGHPPRPQV